MSFEIDSRTTNKTKQNKTNTMETTTNTTQQNAAVEKKPEAVKIDLSKLPCFDLPRKDVVLKLVPATFGKKGDRTGQVFYTFETITPENEATFRTAFADVWYKKLNTLWRSIAQQMDTVLTKKGEEPIDVEGELVPAFQSFSTRGEPIGVMKEQVELHRQWFMALTDFATLSEAEVNSTFEKINAASIAKHDADENADEDSDPVLLDTEMKDKLIAAFYEEIQKVKNDPENTGLQMKHLQKIAQSDVNKRIFSEIGAKMKELNATILKNTKVRKPRKAKVEGEAETEVEQPTEGEVVAA